MTPARGTVPFCFVDVFASRPLTGNPLSLIPDADGLAESQLQAIAREFNQSETTFVLRPSKPDATWRLDRAVPATERLAAVLRQAAPRLRWRPRTEPRHRACAG